jgi:hypothetical protein
VNRARRGPNLFEVMNKAPQVQYPTARRNWFARKPAETTNMRVPTVAQALTEEEAAAELAGQKAAAEQRARAKAAKKAERLAAKEAARQAKDAAKAARAAAKSSSASQAPGDHAVRIAGGRVVVSFNTVVTLVTAAAVCVVMLGAYSLGRRSSGTDSTGKLAPAAAIARTGEQSPTPLLPSLAKPQDKAKPARREEAPQNADLSHLLQEPPARQPEAGVVANGSPKPAEEPADEAAAAKLNYLQIESFRITRDRSGEVVAKDLEEARKFLAERGVKTIARQHANGYVLYSAQGFPPDKDAARQRDTFRKKIEALGQEYRRTGGAYGFKGCDFVGYANTRAGRPA